MQSPDFWSDHVKAGQLSKELTELKEHVEFWESFEKRIAVLTETDEILVRQIKKQFDTQYVKIFLSGKYDQSDFILSVHAGAGGEDALDWAGMLMEMYRKYCEGKGFTFRLLHTMTAEVSGSLAYGYLKREAGVHRLVRISPYDANKRRHTSFALVEIVPELADATIVIKPEDLRIDTFRSSGPGGQNVNKLETAVRVTHIPTNTVVAVQSERSQAQNKEKAMQVLHSKLALLLEEQKVKEIGELQAATKGQSIEWGSQLRSYVLNPYKSVKDHRTGVESTQPDKVLDGELDEFINAELIQ